jgi:hypothetical protein
MPGNSIFLTDVSTIWRKACQSLVRNSVGAKCYDDEFLFIFPFGFLEEEEEEEEEVWMGSGRELWVCRRKNCATNPELNNSSCCLGFKVDMSKEHGSKIF